MGERWLVSACLLGERCRYDGGSRPAEAARRLLDRLGAEHVVAACPEELGGLGTPRPPAQLRGGDGAAVLAGAARVVRDDGTDVTAAFVEGARRALARAPDAGAALLKARSPSCGVGRTWVDGEVRDGDGVFAALLRRRGLSLHTDEDG